MKGFKDTTKMQMGHNFPRSMTPVKGHMRAPPTKKIAPPKMPMVSPLPDMSGDVTMAKGGANWIQGAIKHPGALHRELGVPEGKRIPAKKLAKAAKSDDPTLAKRARFAETLKVLRKAKGGMASSKFDTPMIKGRC